MSATAARSTHRIQDHRYYFVVAVGLIAVVLAGFFRTYFLKNFFGQPPLSALVHIHGAVMTAWYLLFFVQVRLVATNRISIHRTLGWVGAFLAALVAALGTAVSIGLAHRRLQLNPVSKGAPFLLGMQLISIVLVFAILVTLAIFLRRRPDYHKRLMTLAMLTALGPAIVRLPFIDDHNIPAAIVVSNGLIFTCVITDWIRHRRLHPAFGYGTVLVIGTMLLTFPFAQSNTWAHIVRNFLA